MRPIALSAFALVACAHAPPPPEAAPKQAAAAAAPPAPAPAPVKAAEKPPTPPPPSVKEASIYFDFDSATLSEQARAALQSVADALKANDATRLRIEGNCDERGTTEYNLALGQRRADAARKYLVDLGVSAPRLTATSNGKEKPRASGHDEAAWQQNRRDELVPDPPAVSQR